jgi:hypothetical protein
MNMNSELWKRLRDLGEQRRAQIESTLHPEWPEQVPEAGAEPTTPPHPNWIHSPWFEEWKRLAGITS